MSYIPEDAKWYIAEIIEEIKVEDDPRNVVHTNTVLVRADSPEEAYEKAIELGKDWERTYNNSENKTVQIKFRGLGDLNVILDELEHGAELIFFEDIDVPEDKIQSWITSNKKLGVFVPRKKSKGSPNYMAGCIAKELLEKGVPPEELP